MDVLTSDTFTVISVGDIRLNKKTTTKTKNNRDQINAKFRSPVLCLNPLLLALGAVSHYSDSQENVEPEHFFSTLINKESLWCGCCHSFNLHQVQAYLANKTHSYQTFPILPVL